MQSNNRFAWSLVDYQSQSPRKRDCDVRRPASAGELVVDLRFLQAYRKGIATVDSPIRLLAITCPRRGQRVRQCRGRRNSEHHHAASLRKRRSKKRNIKHWPYHGLGKSSADIGSCNKGRVVNRRLRKQRK
jgi:hypothetical protein